MQEVVDATEAASESASFLVNIGGITGIIALVGMVLERVGKAIPDTATGFPGVIRKIAKIVSMYTPNKQ